MVGGSKRSWAGNLVREKWWVQMSYVTTGTLSNPKGGEGSSRQTGIGLSLSKLHLHPWSIEFTKRETPSRVLHPLVVTGDLSHGHTAPLSPTETTPRPFASVSAWLLLQYLLWPFWPCAWIARLSSRFPCSTVCASPPKARSQLPRLPGRRRVLLRLHR